MGSGCSSESDADGVFFTSGCDRLWGHKLDLDPHLVKFLDVGSAGALRDYNQGLMASTDKAPEYARQVVTLLGGFTSVPQAFGIGALFLAIFLEFALKRVKQEPNTESLLQKVFAQEKVSEIRNLMETYARRWRASARHTPRLVAETSDYEKKLHEQLVRVRNSMLYDGHLDTRALRLWMHGAILHVHMNIYLAALQGLRGPGATGPISSYIQEYLKDGEALLGRYQPFRRHQIALQVNVVFFSITFADSSVTYIDSIWSSEHEESIRAAWGSPLKPGCTDYLLDSFVEKMRAKCPAPPTFINYLNQVKSNLNALVQETGTFRIG